MKYCVLVKISKQQLGFWYQFEGGEYTPLSINGPNKIPLCFYVNGNDFKIGEFAKERFLVNDKNAYNDYFELVKDPTNYFTLHGDSKPIKQLLYYGVENYLSHFIKTILYKNESIEGFRKTFCLRFWLNDDIENQEKVLVENLFKEAGYENVAEVNADFFLNKVLDLEVKSTRSRINLFAISNDLYVKLFKSPDFTLLCQVKLEQLGSDPRAQILAKLILEDIKEAIPHIYIDEEKEIAHIINHCVQLLSSLMPIMRNDIELSTGVRAEYKIRQAQLEERLVYNRGVEDKVIPQLESILSANGHSGSSIDIILNGDELNTNYFKDKLTKKFPVVFGVGSSIESKILKYIFYDIFENSYKVNQKITLGHSKNGEKSVSVSKMPPGITTPPVVKMPPVLKVPPVPNKKDVNTQEKKADNKLEVKTPPIIKPEVKLPPVIKDVKKVNIPLTPPSKGKVPPPPSPVKKK